MDKPWLQHYEDHVPKSLNIPDKTVPDILDVAIRKHPDHPAIIYFSRKISYGTLGALVNRFAAALSAMGVKKGDRVAIILPNIPQYPVIHFAVLKLGAIAVPTNPLYVERELEHQLRDSGAKIAVALDLVYKRLESVRQRTSLETVIYTGVADYLPWVLRMLYPIKAKRQGNWVKIRKTEDTFSFSELIKKAYPPPQMAAITPQDLAILLYTGGTTGISKGAMLTHKNLVANIAQVQVWFGKTECGEEKILAVLPLFHSYGMTTCMHLSVYIGAAMILIPRFDIDMILRALEKHKVTMFPGVPTMYVAVNNNPRTPKYDLTSVKACISGGAALPLEVARTFESITRGARLVEGYGLSETSPVTHCNPIRGERREGSIGLPVPQTEAMIVSEETRQPVPVGEVGELAVRGPQVMQGYWNMEEETRRVLQDGWLFTGDMAKMDEDGYFYVVDRKKDMIISGGFNIYPREVEEVLFKHPKVLEAAVVGAPDPYRGEVVKAFVVLKENQRATEEEIIEFCRQELARYKVPKAVVFKRELPKTLIGKVLRRALKDDEQERHETGSVDSHPSSLSVADG